jgi:hypothetical protein
VRVSRTGVTVIMLVAAVLGVVAGSQLFAMLTGG